MATKESKASNGDQVIVDVDGTPKSGTVRAVGDTGNGNIIFVEINSNKSGDFVEAKASDIVVTNATNRLKFRRKRKDR